jgi:hypothetical protein
MNGMAHTPSPRQHSMCHVNMGYRHASLRSAVFPSRISISVSSLNMIFSVTNSNSILIVNCGIVPPTLNVNQYYLSFHVKIWGIVDLE